MKLVAADANPLILEIKESRAGSRRPRRFKRRRTERGFVGLAVIVVMALVSLLAVSVMESNASLALLREELRLVEEQQVRKFKDGIRPAAPPPAAKPAP